MKPFPSRVADVQQVRRAAQVPEVVHGAQVPAGAGAAPQAVSGGYGRRAEQRSSTNHYGPYPQLLPDGALPRQAQRAGGVPADGPGHVALRRRAPSQPRLQPLRRQQPLG